MKCIENGSKSLTFKAWAMKWMKRRRRKEINGRRMTWNVLKTASEFLIIKKTHKHINKKHCSHLGNLSITYEPLSNTSSTRIAIMLEYTTCAQFNSQIIKRFQNINRDFILDNQFRTVTMAQNKKNQNTKSTIHLSCSIDEVLWNIA